MAKILKNENESPEVDLKNLTVKLAGMGLDEEIEDVIPGKKDKKNNDESSSSDDEEDKDVSSETEEQEKPDSEEETSDEEDPDQSDEVAEFYEKRAAERDLTLEKVEELEGAMEEADGEKKQKLGLLDTVVAKSEKETAVIKKEKKKAKFDAIAIMGIVAAILALVGGAVFIFFQMHEEPNLGITEAEFRQHYAETAIYKSISSYGFSFAGAKYRDEADSAMNTSTVTTPESSTVDPTAVTTAIESKYNYFDGAMTNSFDIPIFYSGKEFKENKLLKQIRFFAPITQDDELDIVKVAFAAFLQSFYVDADSQTCANKIANAYSQSLASANAAVMVKDGKLAYAVSRNTIDGVPCLVLDIVPAKEADEFVYYNVLMG